MSSGDHSTPSNSDQYDQQRKQLRQFYCDTWEKHLKQLQVLLRTRATNHRCHQRTPRISCFVREQRGEC